MNEMYEILQRPTTIDNVHESCFRSYSILEQVLIMVGRGDSRETIEEVAEMLSSAERDVKSAIHGEGKYIKGL